MRLDTWSVRDGLPSRAITAITQTPDGFIWLGTESGLIRFDGVTFDTYDTSNTPSMPSDLIKSLYVSKSGDLWVGTDWGGFGRFANGKFIAYQPLDPSWSSVHCIAGDPDGSIWVGAWGSQPVRHVIGGKVIVCKWGTNPEPYINAMLPIGHGQVICGLPWGQPELLNSDGTMHPMWPSFDLGIPCSALLRGDDGAIWYGTGLSGLIRIKNGIMRRFTVHDGLASDNVSCLARDRYGRIWIGTSNGLNVWNGRTFEQFGKSDGLYDSMVGSIQEDTEGNMWVGSGVALNRFAKTKLIPFTMERGTDTATFYGSTVQAPDPEGGMWSATTLGLWHLEVGATVHCIFPISLGDFFEGVVETSNGRLWLWSDPNSGGHYVYCITPKSGPSLANLEKLLWSSKPSNFVVKKISMPTDIECAVSSGENLVGFTSTSVLTIHPDGTVDNQSYAGAQSSPFCAVTDSNGTAWIGDSNGLYHRQHNKMVLLDNGLAPGSHVLGVDASDPKRIWLATDHGIALFSNGKSQMIGKSAGLPDTNIFEIKADRENDLWLGSNRGLFKLSIPDITAYLAGSRKSVPVTTFGAADGIRSYPNCFSTQEATDGSLWFAGGSGITVVQPDNTDFNRVPPPVSIEAAQIDDVNLSPNSLTTVSPGVGRLSIRFAGLSFEAPERVRFRYMLEGLDTAWTDGSNRRSVSYPYLAPGSYRFIVQACNNDGVWNLTGASVAFELLPHYYETLWFKVLCAVLAVLALTLAYYMRVRQMVRHSRELERKVAERTAAVVVSNDQLAQRNGDLEAMQHELKAHISELSAIRESLAAANEHLEALATTDGLTGLKNHRSFQVQLETEWHRSVRYDAPLSIIMIDVDKFKQFNDTFGHPGGDEVLMRVAGLLYQTARETDFVARYGGEEFVIIAPETDEAGAIILAERCREEIEQADWPLRTVTASFGVATSSLATTSGADLLEKSDKALLYSKTDGRNRVTHISSIRRTTPAAAT